MSEEIREFNWREEQERRQGRCLACSAAIPQGYIYHDRFGFTYCRDCFMAYKDLASQIRGRG
jgi:hypothetical protein